MKIYTSLASFPGATIQEACLLANNGVSDPFYGQLSVNKVQLVPQNRGHLDSEVVQALMSTYPNTEFRLHANVRIAHNGSNILKITDLSSYSKQKDWFESAAKLSKQLKAKAYTLHSGYSKNADMQTIVENCKRIQDLFECKVGIEGQYPTIRNDLLMTTWDDYRFVMESGCYFVLDLSHLNILQKALGPNEKLCEDMISHENCLEIHLSANNGKADTHSLITSEIWWHPLLQKANKNADIFYEGNLLKQKNQEDTADY